MSRLVNVVAVKIKAPHSRCVMQRDLTPEDAEAYIKFAVMRRGVEEEFYITEHASDETPTATKGTEK